MPHFAANLTMLFAELPLLERFAAAQHAGFDAVEVLFPYDHDPKELRAALDDCGLPLILFNTPPGDWQNGERGFAAVPGAEGRFNEGLALALEYAEILRPAFIHVMSGNAAGPKALDTLLGNLHRAVQHSPRQGFLIEPLNPYDMPGYFLNDFATASHVIADINAANLGLQFDAYHAHRITGDLLGTWNAFGHQTQHIQIADHPGRHEPGSGEIPFAAFFEHLKSSAYTGWISAEYHPANTTVSSLGWLKP